MQKTKEMKVCMKIFTLLIICALANHFLGWSLLVLALVAAISYVCETVFDNLIKLTLRKLVLQPEKSFVVGRCDRNCSRRFRGKDCTTY